jgi:hypothetical protein
VCIELGLKWMRVLLRGHGAESPTGDSFFKLIAVEPEMMDQASPSDSAWRSAILELFAVDMANLQAFDEPFEAFHLQVEQGLSRAAEWLNSRPAEAFEDWRASGRKSDIFIHGWLLNEQFDLTIPPPFLSACGRLKLPITICTND